jgi:hypothetical protein
MAESILKQWTNPDFIASIMKAQTPAPGGAAAPPPQQTNATGTAGADELPGPRKATETTLPPPAAKGKASKPAGLSALAVMTLVDGLQYLNRPEFMRGSTNGTPAVPPLPKATGTPTVDALLRIATEVVKLRNNPKTLPKAFDTWQALKPRILAVFTEAQGPALGLDASYIKDARREIEQMDGGLRVMDDMFNGKQKTERREKEAYDKLDHAEKVIEIPDMAEATELRKAKQFESTFELLKAASKHVGLLAKKGSNFQKVTKVIEIYFSVEEMKEKLEAFREKGLLGKAATAADFAALLGEISHVALEGYTHAALHLAEKAGNKVLVSKLMQRIGVLKKVAAALAIYDAIKSTIELIEAIETGDPHAITAAAAKLAITGIDLAESTEAISGPVASGAVVVVVVIWAEVDTILGVLELHKWAMDYAAQQAFKRMVADAKKVVPFGKKMAAAAHLMTETDSTSPEYDVYQKQAIQYAQSVKKALAALAGNNLSRDPNSVGGHPDLVAALGQPAQTMLGQVQSGVLPDEPFTLSDAFRTIVAGIKAMVTEGDKTYGAA